MPDPLSIAAAAIAVASASLQVLGKSIGKPGSNGYGRALAEQEIRLTNQRREELDEAKKEIIDRVHGLGNRVSELGLRHDLKLGELDTEIKLIKQFLTRKE